MSRRAPLVCLWCGRVLPNGGDIVLHRLAWPNTKLKLAWCLDCAEKDPLHTAQADIISRFQDPGHEARVLSDSVRAIIAAGPDRHGPRWPFVARSAGLEWCLSPDA